MPNNLKELRQKTAVNYKNAERLKNVYGMSVFKETWKLTSVYS